MLSQFGGNCYPYIKSSDSWTWVCPLIWVHIKSKELKNIQNFLQKDLHIFY